MTVWCAGLNEKQFHSNPHTKPSSTHSDIQVYQMYWYNEFSWWWVHGCPKHVENRNIHENNCASSWLCTRIIPRFKVNRTKKEQKINLELFQSKVYVELTSDIFIEYRYWNLKLNRDTHWNTQHWNITEFDSEVKGITMEVIILVAAMISEYFGEIFTLTLYRAFHNVLRDYKHL
jgi:hypothetical protein